MALNKTSISIASGGKSEFDLSCDHQTSMNFLLAQPVYYRHLPRGEHFNCKSLGVIRPVSMSVPTFGRIRNNLRAFFVPYRLVFNQYDTARADVLGYSFTSSAAIPIDTPRFSNIDLCAFFLYTNIPNVGMLVDNLGSTDPTTLNPPVQYDFKFSGNYYRYTAAGRRRLKIIRSLGYEPIWASKGDVYFDALALLSYAQIYLDWYANSQYLDSSDVVNLRTLLSYNNPTAPLVLSQVDITTLMDFVFAVVYDSDEYFNAAWDTPVAPTVGQWSTPTPITDLTGSASISVDVDGTPYMSKFQGGQSLGTQYLHDMLQALSNYQRRHALSGAREIDRALADYGFVSDYASLKRSVYIGNRSFDVNIGDVFSYADTSGTGVSNLGDFAGRGFGNGQGEFDFTASEDGIIIIISTIIPSCGIVQGYDRNNRHLNKFDFYDPNFEVGVQVLEKGEVYVSSKEDFHSSDSEEYTSKFAFTGRFAEYKRPRSWWTSENRCASVDAGGDAWNLFRLFTDANFGDDVDNLVHSLDFTVAMDWENFNRIFNYVSSDRDKFDCFYHHEVHSQSPMKPLFETYDFKEMHKQIKMDINGSKLN